jgi:hypothetical protein
VSSEVGNPSITALSASLAGLTGEALHERLRAVLPALPLADRFVLLHRLGVYHHPESFSGAASTHDETRRLRDALPALIRSEGVRRLLDVPCGDFHWMSTLELGVDYTGVDVVPELVERNRRLYERPGRRFLCLDATRDALPAADLVLCRDLLIHLSLADIDALLRNFVKSGARRLLTSHFADRTENVDVLSGDFHTVNLCHAPFHLPPPRLVILEGSALSGGAFPDRAMALWEMRGVATALGRYGARSG